MRTERAEYLQEKQVLLRGQPLHNEQYRAQKTLLRDGENNLLDSGDDTENAKCIYLDFTRRVLVDEETAEKSETVDTLHREGLVRR